MTISLHTKMETSTQNSGWRMSIMETIGMTLTGERNTKDEMEHLLVSVLWKTAMPSVE